jgi:ribosomal protein L37AE/L43A
MSGDNNPSKRPSQKALISEVQKNLVAEGNHYLQSPEARHSSSIRGKLLASQGLHPSQTTEFKEAQSKRASRASKRRAEEGSLFFQTADGIEKTRQRNKQLASEGRHPSQCEEFKKRASERVKNREFRLVICEECSKQFSTNALAKSKRCGSIECERSSNRKKTQRYRDRKKVTAND